MKNQENQKMPVVILCGGKGTRMKEETEFKPKPLVLVGGKPILWHIMKIYAHYGYNEFILALGYKGEMIKNYFLNQKVLLNDFTLETLSEKIDFHNNNHDNFKITFVETGLESLTGARLLKIKKYIKTNDFMVTYGDGVADINISKLALFHKEQKTIGTITGVHPHSRYGLLKIDKISKRVRNFDQKPLMHDYINGGFAIFNKKVFDYFDSRENFESSFPKLAKKNQLSAYVHEGFWQGMDTYHEMEVLNKLWETKKPWMVWKKQ